MLKEPPLYPPSQSSYIALKMVQCPSITNGPGPICWKGSEVPCSIIFRFILSFSADLDQDIETVELRLSGRSKLKVYCCVARVLFSGDDTI